MQTYYGKMKCVDELQGTEIFGSYNTEKASNLMIVFEKCNNNTATVQCKSSEEINEWLQFKYLLVLENEKRFVQDGFFENRIRRESSTKWYALSPDIRTDYVK